MKMLGKIGGCLVVAMAALGAMADEVAEGSESEVVLPDGYVRLLYIKSYGLQYIDTRMKLHAPSDVVHMKFMCTKENDQGMLFGNRVDGTHQAFAAHYNDTTAGGGGLIININNSSAAGNLFQLLSYKSVVSGIFNQMLEISASVSGVTVKVGDVVCGPQKFTHIDTFETAGTCTVLKGVPVPGHESGLPNNNGVTGDLYSFSIVSNGVTVLDLIPVRRNLGSGDESGMFDTLSGQFFGSSSGEPFIPGPDVGQQEEIVIESREGRRIGLSFAPVTFARTLYVCYGVTDGASDPGKWSHCEKVADVPAGATTASAILPKGFGTTYAVARFALDVAPDSYAGNLIAQYDGIDNVRSPEGVVSHQNGVGLTWANLAGVSGMYLGDCEATADGVVYDRTQGAGAAFQSESYAAFAVNAIEAVVCIDGVVAGADGALWSGANGQLPVPQLRVKNYQTYVVCGSDSANGSIVSPFLTVDKGRAFSVAYVRLGSSTTWAVFVNGVSAGVSVGFEPLAGCIDFGNMSTASRGTRGKFYAIRLHSAALGAHQVRANFMLDGRRFADLRPSVRMGSISPAIGSSSTGVWVSEMTRDASSTLTSATLEFPAVSGRADIYAALAKTDCGDSTNGWSVVSKVGTAVSGDTSFTCDLAGLPCNRYSKIRFFMEHEPQRNYVDGGSLLRWWDGLNNSISAEGRPFHSVTAGFWSDLASCSVMSFDCAVRHVVDNGIYFEHKGTTSASYAMTQSSFGADDIQTIEVMIKLDGSCAGSDGALWGGYGTDTPVPQCRVGTKDAAPADFVLGWSSASSVIGNPYYKGNWGDFISVTYVRNGSEFVAYTNGAPTGVSQQFTPKGGRICFGGLSSAPRGVDAVYHSIRLYSKALTPGEIAANYAVDKAWLFDPKPLLPSRSMSIRKSGLALILK